MSSPAVQTQTIDQSYYQAGITPEIGAYVGYFEKGPINTPVFITDVNDFKFIFGRGLDMHFNDWYQVYNYLQYSSGIWVVRASGNQQYNANNGAVIEIQSSEDFENKYGGILLEYNKLRVIARTPGDAGNLLSVAIFGNKAYQQNAVIGHGIRAKELFTFMQEDLGGVVVFRNGQVVEKFQIDNDELKNINKLSKYCYFKITDDLTDFGEWYGDTLDEVRFKYPLITLSKGSTNFATDDDFREAHTILANKDSYDFDIIIGNEYDNMAAVQLAETRRDCIAFCGLPTSFVTFLKTESEQNNDVLYTEEGLILALDDFKPTRVVDVAYSKEILKYIESLGQSNFVHFTGNIKEQIDGFTDRKRIVNIAADVAGLKAKASLISPWTPGAGLEKGLILNSQGMFMKIDYKARENLYKRGLNFVEQGMLLSQKTLTSVPSAFSRVNVRSMFNHLEKTVERVLRKYVFEENREGVRRTISIEVKKVLEDIRVNRGIEAGKVIVDVGATPNEIIVDVYVKPTYVAEYIQMRMVNIGTNTTTSLLSNTLG